tara:strand:- start:5125 stop:5619 length:495 start_codon:yes stop_codon:yes gene_type:complete
MKQHNDPLSMSIYALIIVYVLFVLPNIKDSILNQLNNKYVFIALSSIIVYISLDNHLMAFVLACALVLTLKKLHNRQNNATVEIPELNVPKAKKLIKNHSLDNISDSNEYVKNRSKNVKKKNYKKKVTKLASDDSQVQTLKKQQGTQGLNKIRGFDTNQQYTPF